VPVRVPAAGQDDEACERTADDQSGPPSPPAALDGHAEGDGDDEGGKAHGECGDSHPSDDDELE
jgi:hypothetical protein